MNQPLLWHMLKCAATGMPSILLINLTLVFSTLDIDLVRRDLCQPALIPLLHRLAIRALVQLFPEIMIKISNLMLYSIPHLPVSIFFKISSKRLS